LKTDHTQLGRLSLLEAYLVTLLSTMFAVKTEIEEVRLLPNATTLLYPMCWVKCVMAM